MKTDRIPDTGALRAAYSTELLNHFQNCRNFLALGPFYPTLELQYSNFTQLSVIFPTFGVFLDSLPLIQSFPDLPIHERSYFNLPESKVWELYCQGHTIREISKELQRLYKLGEMPKSPKTNMKYQKRLPYSIFYVHSALKTLKINMIAYNLNNPEDNQDMESPDILSNNLVDL